MRSREVAKEHVTNNQNARNSSASATLPVMDGDAINRALRRIAHEIIERNPELASVVLVGIPSRGVEITRRIAGIIESLGKAPIETGVLDVSMHRDDVGKRAELPRVQASRLPLPLENKTVIIVDDVFFTGRTARAAMDAISSFGRPARIQLAALIDRGHRELPIRVDYVGKNLPTAAGERVRLRLENVDGEPDAVWLVKEEKA
jgi:pyrimidine operon attenuation protein/uracil phosphoribosyltransferase